MAMIFLHYHTIKIPERVVRKRQDFTGHCQPLPGVIHWKEKRDSMVVGYENSKSGGSAL